MANVKTLVGYEFTVVEATDERLLLSDENGQLFQVEAYPLGDGQDRLHYYELAAKEMTHG